MRESWLNNHNQMGQMGYKISINPSNLITCPDADVVDGALGGVEQSDGECQGLAQVHSAEARWSPAMARGGGVGEGGAGARGSTQGVAGTIWIGGCVRVQPDDPEGQCMVAHGSHKCNVMYEMR
jgi:hypothetical protein